MTELFGSRRAPSLRAGRGPPSEPRISSRFSKMTSSRKKTKRVSWGRRLRRLGGCLQPGLDLHRFYRIMRISSPPRRSVLASSSPIGGILFHRHCLHQPWRHIIIVHSRKNAVLLELCLSDNAPSLASQEAAGNLLFTRLQAATSLHVVATWLTTEVVAWQLQLASWPETSRLRLVGLQTFMGLLCPLSFLSLHHVPLYSQESFGMLTTNPRYISHMDLETG